MPATSITAVPVGVCQINASDMYLTAYRVMYFACCQVRPLVSRYTVLPVQPALDAAFNHVMDRVHQHHIIYAIDFQELAIIEAGDMRQGFNLVMMGHEFIDLQPEGFVAELEQRAGTKTAKDAGQGNGIRHGESVVCQVSGCLRRDVELFLGQRHAHNPLDLRRYAVIQHILHGIRHHLPGHAPGILQPTALA